MVILYLNGTKFLNNRLFLGSKIDKNKKNLKVGKVGDKDNILTVQKKKVVHIGNNTKISLEMTPRQREAETQRLKVAKMRMRKLIEE